VPQSAARFTSVSAHRLVLVLVLVLVFYSILAIVLAFVVVLVLVLVLELYRNYVWGMFFLLVVGVCP
jgi:hypothetical protein